MPSNRSDVFLGPRGPRGVPLLGSLLEFGSDPLSFFTRCAHDYGDCVAFCLGRRPAFLLNHPDLIEQVFLADSSTSTNRPRSHLVESQDVVRTCVGELSTPAVCPDGNRDVSHEPPTLTAVDTQR